MAHMFTKRRHFEYVLFPADWYKKEQRIFGIWREQHRSCYFITLKGIFFTFMHEFKGIRNVAAICKSPAFCKMPWQFTKCRIC